MRSIAQWQQAPTRRSVALGLLACGLVATLPVPGRDARAAAPVSRIVSLDWTGTAMLLSLGTAPVGVGDADLYRLWVGEPPLPPGTADVGLRDTPNPEAVAALEPDLILVSPLGAAARSLLERIAPTYEVSLQRGEGDVLARAEGELLSLARVLGREVQANEVIAGSRALFASLRARLAQVAPRRLTVVQFLDQRFVRVYGEQSMPGAVLHRLGLVNAWTPPVNAYGFSLVGTERLAAFPDAEILVIDPLPPGVSLAPDSASLWGNLPAVRQGRARRLPAVWTFGEITAADRFAGLLTAQLLGGGDARF